MIFNRSREGNLKPPVKGTGVKAMMAFAKEVGGKEGVDRLLSSLPEEDRRILSEPILPTNRFQESTNQNLINGIVRTILGGDAERAVEIGRFLINEGLNFVYKALYKVGNPSWIISNAGLLWKMYHEVGSLEVLEVHPNSCVIQLDFPFLDKAFCRVIAGCSLQSLELSGGKDVTLIHRTCISKGDSVCTYALEWH